LGLLENISVQVVEKSIVCGTIASRIPGTSISLILLIVGTPENWSKGTAMNNMKSYRKPRFQDK
jgi:hypothetical protein